MRFKWAPTGLAISAVCCFAIASAVSKPAALSPGTIAIDKLARITVGSSTDAQVRRLLGDPLRMTSYGDCNVVDYQDIWEYQSRDASGSVRISIQFDETGMARIITKTPSKGPVVVLAAAPPPPLCRSRRL